MRNCRLYIFYSQTFAEPSDHNINLQNGKVQLSAYFSVALDFSSETFVIAYGVKNGGQKISGFTMKYFICIMISPKQIHKERNA